MRSEIADALLALGEVPDDVREFARHAKSCAECLSAVTPDQLCVEGGPLWDAIDLDPTDPGVLS